VMKYCQEFFAKYGNRFDSNFCFAAKIIFQDGLGLAKLVYASVIFLSN
jgi:hypothetical protein